MDPHSLDPPFGNGASDPFGALYLTAPVGLCVVDTGLRYLQVNQRLAEMHGVPIPDHLGRTPSQVLPRSGELVESTYRLVLEGGQPVDGIEIPSAVAPLGSWILNHRPLRSQDGTVHAISSMVLDPAETTSKERPISLKDERTKVLLEATNAVPWEADVSTWRFTYVGPQAVRLLGYSVESWLEDGFWAAHLHAEDRERAIAYCQEYSRSSENYEFEYRMIAADGREVWLHDIVNVEYSGGVPTKLRGFLVDISERKRVEQEAASTSEDLTARACAELRAMTSELLKSTTPGRPESS